jgi:uncharacterized protein (TIGR03435 family)
MRISSLTVLQALTLSATLAQQPAAPAFEATSIKLNNSVRLGGGLNLSHARIKFINSTLKFCIQVAWDVKDFQISGGAGWTESEHYDIEAVAAKPFEHDEYRAMIQTMLADRFGLAIHHALEDRSGYALVVSKNGPKLPPPEEDPSFLFSRTASGDRTLQAKSATMGQLASGLSFVLGKVVIDKTGIEGRYDVSMQWTPDPSNALLNKSGMPEPVRPADAAPGPTIYTVLQEKLGLKLESRRVPVDVIVIDQAHRPSAN